MKKLHREGIRLVSIGIIEGTHSDRPIIKEHIALSVAQYEQIDRADFLLKRLEKKIGTFDNEMD